MKWRLCLVRYRCLLSQLWSESIRQWSKAWGWFGWELQIQAPTIYFAFLKQTKKVFHFEHHYHHPTRYCDWLRGKICNALRWFLSHHHLFQMLHVCPSVPFHIHYYINYYLCIYLLCIYILYEKVFSYCSSYIVVLLQHQFAPKYNSRGLLSAQKYAWLMIGIYDTSDS